ncbi:hypothetical protein [Scytonema sp. PRP1]
METRKPWKRKAPNCYDLLGDRPRLRREASTVRSAEPRSGKANRT